MTKAFINERVFDLPDQDRRLVPIHGNCIDNGEVTFSTSEAYEVGQGTDYIDFTVTGDAHYAIGDEDVEATIADRRINERERIQEQIAPGQYIAFIDAAD